MIKLFIKIGIGNMDDDDDIDSGQCSFCIDVHKTCKVQKFREMHCSACGKCAMEGIDFERDTDLVAVMHSGFGCIAEEETAHLGLLNGFVLAAMLKWQFLRFKIVI